MSNGFKVPILERRVQPQELPSAPIGASVTAADFGGIEAEAIGRIGGQVQQLGATALAFEEQKRQRQAKYQDDLDKLYANDALIKYKDNIRNTRENFFAKKGVNAVGVADEAQKYLDELYRDLSKDMTPNQKRYFDSSIRASHDLLLNQTTSHQASEFVRTKEANNEARRELAKDEAANIPGSYNEDLALENAMNDLTFGIDSTIKDLGMTGAEAKVYKQEHLSEFHLNYLNSQAVNDIEKAKEYYKKYKKDINPESRDTVEKLLNEEDILQFAQGKTDEIVRVEQDHQKRLEIAREIKDPDKRAKTVELVKTRNTEEKQAQNEKENEEYLESLDNIMNKAKTYDEGIAYSKQNSNPENQRKAEKFAKDRLDVKGKPIVTDRDKFLEVLEKIDNDEIRELRQLIEYSPFLSDGDYNRAITAFRQKQNPDPKAATVSYSTAKNALSTVLSKPYNPKKHGKMFMFALDNLEKEAQSKGRTLTLDESIKSLSKYAVEGEQIGFVYDEDMPYFEAIQEGVDDVWVPKIEDDAERNLIIDGFQRDLGVTPSENETLFRLYKKEEILGIELSPEQSIIYNQEIVRELEKRAR